MICPFSVQKLAPPHDEVRPTQCAAFYGLLLLGIFGVFHHSQEDWSAGTMLPNNELARFAAAAFKWLAVGQALIVMALVPAMVAGSVAEDRSRQTLAGLLVTRLSSTAIILDKLAAKMLQIGVFLAVGLPIACLLGLLGGIDPRSIVYAYSGTVSTAFFLVALSLLVSVYARGPRTAILLVYLIEPFWLFAPWVVDFVSVMGAPRWFRTVASWNAWILPATPLSLVTPATLAGWNGRGLIAWLLETLTLIRPRGLTAGWTGPGALTVALGRMIGWQVACGAVLLFWASWRLRPVARRLADAPRRRTDRGWSRRRSRVRPPCGDDPMLWKECTSRDHVPAQVGLWFGLLGFGLLTLFTHERFIRDYRRALDEFFVHGYSSRPHHWDFFARDRFVSDLLVYSVLFYIAALLAIAVKSATGVTTERDAETWDGVLSTLLEPVEIVRAKVLGAISGQRALLFLVVAPWLFGLALGALHPIGLLLAITGLAVFLCFAALLGTLFSLRSKSSGRALVRTLGVLLMLNLGTVLVGVLLGSPELAIFLGSTPMLLYALPLSNHVMQAVVTHRGNGSMLVGMLSAFDLAYAVLAWLLWRSATRRFDLFVDRPESFADIREHGALPSRPFSVPSAYNTPS